MGYKLYQRRRTRSTHCISLCSHHLSTCLSSLSNLSLIALLEHINYHVRCSPHLFGYWVCCILNQPKVGYIGSLYHLINPWDILYPRRQLKLHNHIRVCYGLSSPEMENLWYQTRIWLWGYISKLPEPSSKHYLLWWYKTCVRPTSTVPWPQT